VEIEQDLKAQHETSLKMQDLHNIGFQYIGLGHQHRHKHYDKDHAYLPGSLEDYSDVEWTWEKGFYIVEAAWEERDPKSMETRGKFYAITRTRPREKVSWDIGRVTTEDAVTAIKTRLTDYVTREGEINPEKMYHVEVKGVLTDGRPGELDLGSLWTPFSQNEKDGFFQFTNKLVTVEEEAIAEVEDDDQLLEEIFAGDKYQDYIGETSEEKALFFKEVRDGVLRAATSTKISEKNAQAHSSFVVTVSPRLPEPALTFEDLVVKRHMGGGKE
jgi:DNA repair exonuclease SbcCD nuclease subunit